MSVMNVTNVMNVMNVMNVTRDGRTITARFSSALNVCFPSEIGVQIW